MKGNFRRGVFFVVYKREKGKIKYLVLKRKLHWTGWEFPKGGIEKFETKRSSVKRELFEETSLAPIKIKKFSYSGKYLYPKRLSDRPGMIGQTFTLYSVEVNPGKVKIDKKEHTSSKWLSYFEAQKILTYENQKNALKIVNDWLNYKSKLK